MAGRAGKGGPELSFETPARERVLAFQRILVASGIPAFIRRPRGRDIFAACGQLKSASIKQRASARLAPPA